MRRRRDSGQAPDHTVATESPAGVSAVRVSDPRRVSYVLQPGIPVEEAAPVSAALRSRFPALRGPDPDGFCYAASDRKETIRAVAAASDLVLVLGTEDEPDTRLLAGLARAGRAKAHVIGDAGRSSPPGWPGWARSGWRRRSRPGLGWRTRSPLPCPGSGR
jgi:4-hydroxy-3-methylbut-2-enyl diphosphate reductase